MGPARRRGIRGNEWMGHGMQAGLLELGERSSPRPPYLRPRGGRKDSWAEAPSPEHPASYQPGLCTQ